MNDRGQTPQDFVVGASILLVTIIATFTFVQGSVFQAYDEPVSGDLETASDQVATYLVEHYSVDTERNVLRYNQSDGTGIYEELQADTDLSNLKAASGIDVGTDRRRTPNVNVTIVNSSAIEDGERVPAERGVGSPPDHLAWGPEYRGQDGAASTTRIVRLSDPGHKCKTVCWLIVRAW